MLARSKQIDRLDQVDRQVRAAAAVTADLVSDVIGAACDHLPMLDKTESAVRLHRLVETEAWTDAALALLEIELPQWEVRRLVFEDGRWTCSLSKQAYLPLELDDTVDAAHEVLPLAILGALLNVRGHSLATNQTLPMVPLLPSASGRPVCRQGVFCALTVDNFS
jgi:hypothetical protein